MVETGSSLIHGRVVHLLVLVYIMTEKKEFQKKAAVTRLFFLEGCITNRHHLITVRAKVFEKYFFVEVL